MAKKVIQVPMGENMIDALDAMSRRRRQSRSGLIREACQQYLVQVESEELDKRYMEGYRRLPEETSLGQAQVALADKIIPRESW